METTRIDSRANGQADGHARQSVGALISNTIEDASALGRSEAEYVKAEIADSARRAGLGGVLLGAAAVAGLVAIGMIAATATLALSTAMPTWLAALVVAVVFGVIGGVLALIGIRAMRSASDEITTTVVQRLREDVQWLKHRLMHESM